MRYLLIHREDLVRENFMWMIEGRPESAPAAEVKKVFNLAGKHKFIPQIFRY